MEPELPSSAPSSELPSPDTDTSDTSEPLTYIENLEENAQVLKSSIPGNVAPVLRHILDLQECYNNARVTRRILARKRSADSAVPALPAEPLRRSSLGEPSDGSTIAEHIENGVRAIAQVVGFYAETVGATQKLSAAVSKFLETVCKEWKEQKELAERDGIELKYSGLDAALKNNGFPQGVDELAGHVNWLRDLRQEWIEKCKQESQRKDSLDDPHLGMVKKPLIAKLSDESCSSGKLTTRSEASQTSGTSGSASSPGGAQTSSGSAMEIGSTLTTSVSAMDVDSTGTGHSSSAMDTTSPSPPHSAGYVQKDAPPFPPEEVAPPHPEAAIIQAGSSRSPQNISADPEDTETGNMSE